jgi:tRNA splicing endonuclease
MKALFILGMVLLSTNVFAGNEKGNGGGIHYCAAEKTQELYDIYEGQARYGYTLTDKKLSVENFIQFAIKRIDSANPYIARLVKEQIDYLQHAHMIVRPNMKLTPVDDAKILLVDEGCEYKQLANWDEVSGNLLVNKNYFDQLNNLNKAALYIHESLYKVGRDLGLLKTQIDNTTTSDEIRPMIAEIFSNSESLKRIWQVSDPIEVQKEKDEFLAPYLKMQLTCDEAVNELNSKKNNIDKKNPATLRTYTEALDNARTKCQEVKFIIQLDIDSVSFDYRSHLANIALNAQMKLSEIFYNSQEAFEKVYERMGSF